MYLFSLALSAFNLGALQARRACSDNPIQIRFARPNKPPLLSPEYQSNLCSLRNQIKSGFGSPAEDGPHMKFRPSPV